MSRARTPISSRKGINISDKTRKLYEQRDRSLDADPETRPLPPDRWAQAMRRNEFFRPLKTPVTARIDADVVAWLKLQGEGYQTRMNTILREAMEKEQHARR